jgi:release factor glutamine methyltransferase
MDKRVSALLAEVSNLPGHEARRLLLAAAQVDAVWMIGDPPVSDEIVARFRQLVNCRLGGEPLQYLEGTVQFGPLELKADARALIPRPETEGLWELVVAILRGIDKPVIVDLCTGGGNLALACKHEYPDGRVVGVDISAEAIELARENADRVSLGVEFVRGDLFDAVPGDLRGRVDLIVSNPPYVGAGEVANLPTDVRDYEPHTALIGGPDGTEILARIAAGSGEWLRSGGFIACEIGETQADECLRLFAGFEPHVKVDLAGRPRYLIGWAPESSDLH